MLAGASLHRNHPGLHRRRHWCSAPPGFPHL